MEIDKVCRLAKKKGLSYGQYVLSCREELENESPDTELGAGERRCAFCGRIFRRVNVNNRFCRDSCRFAWHTEKRRKRRQRSMSVEESVAYILGE